MFHPRKVAVSLGVLAITGLLALVGGLRTQPGVDVRTEVVQLRELDATVAAVGQVRAHRQVNLSSELMRRVIEITVEEGDEVRRGQVLIRLDPRQTETAMARAGATFGQARARTIQQLANLEQAKREAVRLRSLHARGIVPVQSLEDAETAVDVARALHEAAAESVMEAQANLVEAQNALDQAVLRAPISGRIVHVNIEEGETAVLGTMNNPGSLLLTIADLTQFEIVLRVNEFDIGHVDVGNEALIELPTFPGRTFVGRVTSVGHGALQGTLTGPPGTVPGAADFEVVVSLRDPPEGLRPGLSATADIVVERAHAVAVPIIAVTVRDGMEGVFVVQQDRVAWQPVTIGMTAQERFTVTSGLAPGDQIVSGPYAQIQELSDGDRITNHPSKAPVP